MKFYKINPSENYLKTLAEFIFEKSNRDFFELSNNLIILPSKRSCLHLKKYFSLIPDNKAVIMPEIISFSDFDEVKVNYHNVISNQEVLTLKKSISKEKQEILLAKLVHENLDTGILNLEINFNQSLKLARSLADLIDTFNRFEIDYSEIQNILPEELSIHKQKSISFLEKIFSIYPEILAGLNLESSIIKRNSLIKNFAKNLKENKQYNNVYIAGTTGSIKSTRNFIKDLLNQDNCHFVFPFIDNFLQKKDFEEIIKNEYLTNHQAHIAILLDDLKINPEEITEISHNKSYDDFASKIMLPANKIYSWNNQALPNKKIHLISAENQIDEAKILSLVIADKLNENKTIAVITNSSNIAENLNIFLEKFNLKADISFGKNLTQTLEGKFTLQIVNFLCDGFKISSLLDIIKSGFNRLDIRNELEIFENKIIKNNNLKNLPEVLNFLQQNGLSEYQDTQKIFFSIYSQVSGLNNVFKLQIVEILDVVEQLLEQFLDENNTNEIWQKISEVFEFLKTELQNEYIEKSVIPDFITNIFNNKTIRDNYLIDNKISILSPIEARLLDFDIVIIAGANEEILPLKNSNIWLSENMLKNASLPGEEHFISSSAHDFASFLNKKEIYISYSNNINGNTAEKSQFVNRLKIFYDTIKSSEILLEEDKKYNLILEHLDYLEKEKISENKTFAKINTLPSKSKISATNIDKTIENPYHFYAKEILKLNKVKPLEKDFENSDYGNFIHQIIEEFTEEHKFNPEKIKISTFTEIANKIYQKKFNHSKNTLTWLMQINLIAKWLCEIEQKKVSELKKYYAEISGSYEIKIADKTFKITAKADRIEVYKDKTISIIDFKTGSAPKPSEVTNLKKPQLPVEGLIVKFGKFSTINNIDIDLSEYQIRNFKYYVLKNSSEGFKEIIIDKNTDELINKANNQAIYLSEQIFNSETKFLTFPDNKENIVSDYKHLMRLI